MPAERPGKGSKRLRIGKYEVISHIATGGMGAVYKAVDTDLGREVALKVLQPEIAAKPGMLDRFRREAQHAAKLRHENIVAIYEIGDVNGTHFLALEFVDGIDLNAYIGKKGKLDPDDALNLLLQAAKALAQVHKQGLVHRDIKPSNFLITRKGNRPLVKLTDLGLAREVDDEEFRVTRAGTTVGTVDYMSPEQARNSRSADIRSDIYSLGCTFYHMLSGRPPFAEGGLTERLYKHISEEPEDICRLNKKAPAAMAAVLRRMMEKKPENRYQTPNELLKDLERIKGGAEPVRQHDVLAALAKDEPAASSSIRKAQAKPAAARSEDPDTDDAPALPAAPSRPAPGRRQRRDGTRRWEGEPLVGGGRPWWPFVAVGGGVLVLVLVAVAIGVHQSGKSSSFEGAGPRTVNVYGGYTIDEDPPPAGRSPQTQPKLPPAEPDKRSLPVTKPEPIRPRPLTPTPQREATALRPVFRPDTPRSGDDLRKDFDGAWTGGSGLRMGDGIPVLHVSRYHRAGPGPHFETLAAACAAVKPDQDAIIEIDDNGPLFEPSIVLPSRGLVIRAGKGFRPLLAWDPALVPTSTRRAEGSAFFTLSSGALRLQDLDVVHKCSDAGPAGSSCLLRLAGGEADAWGCTFSVAGRRADGVAVLHIEPGGRVGKAEASSLRSRFKHCLMRGMDLVALDIRAPGAQVLLDDCLVVGGSRPLLDVRGRSGTTTVVRTLRSTFVGRQAYMRVRSLTPSDRNPAVQWHGLDTLISRCSGESGGAMVVLDGCDKSQVQWHALYCLYAGWSNLLASEAKPIRYSELDVWHLYWGAREGDEALLQTWPDGVPAETAEIIKTNFHPTNEVAYQASTGSPGEPLGCDTNRLPAARDTWLSLAYEPFTAPPYDLPAAGRVPELPAPSEEVYEGEVIDFDARKLDLGEYLATKKHLGRRVVLHLMGAGRVYTSPIRVRGSSLLLYFDKPSEDPDALELWPQKGFPEGKEALIEVTDGNLEIVNGKILFLNHRLQMPRYMLKVHGGDLRLYGCWLTGALGNAPSWYQGLIAFPGSGRPEADRAAECAVVNSVLASGKSCFHTLGTGSRIRLVNSVVFSGGDAFFLDPGSAPATWRSLSALLPCFSVHATGELLLTASLPIWWPVFDREMKYPPRSRFNTQVLLERSTFALRGPLIRLGDAPDLTGPPADAYVVQTRANVLVDPFPGSPRRSGIVQFDANALTRGLLVWRAEGNVYDSGFRYFVTSADRTADAQPLTLWTRMWGSVGDSQATTVDLQVGDRRLNIDEPRLDMLAAAYARAKIKTPPPGSDLVKPLARKK